MFLPILALLSAAPALGQEPLEEAPQELVEPTEVETETEAEAEAEAEAEPQGEGSEAQPKPKKTRRPHELEAEERRDWPLWVAIAALLGLLLASRRQPYRKAAIRKARTRADRPVPITDEELGRFVFHAVVAADLDEFRALFLTGAEAREVLGSAHVERYLSTRTPQRLEDALVELAVQIPEDSHFVGVERADALLSVVIANAQGTEKTVMLGTVAELGATRRMISPADQLQQRAAE